MFAGPGASDPWHVTDYAFDGNGSRISETEGGKVRQYSWDYRERLLGVKDGNTVIQTNTYDPYNRRITMQADGDKTAFLYDGSGITNQGLVEFPLNGNGPVKRNIWLGGQMLVSLEGKQVHFLMADALGSVIALTDGSVAVIQRSFYEPFGKAMVRGSASEDRAGYVGSLGVQHVESTGMDYMWMRYYISEDGLFISKEPLLLVIATLGEIRQYDYSSNNPIQYIDYSGLMTNKEKREQCGTLCIAASIVTHALVHGGIHALGGGGVMSTFGV